MCYHTFRTPDKKLGHTVSLPLTLKSDFYLDGQIQIRGLSLNQILKIEKSNLFSFFCTFITIGLNFTLKFACKIVYVPYYAPDFVLIILFTFM